MTKYSLNHPVTTFMFFLALFLLGTIAFLKLPVSLLPNINFPEITIVTEYKNAAPAEIENLVTRQIEETIASVAGVKDIDSISSEGISIVKVRFSWGKNMDFAAMEIREKIDLIKGSMPQDVHKPIILKYNPSDTPIMGLSVQSPFWNDVRLRQVVEKEIIPALERVDGVASVNVTGGLVREIQVNIDVSKLAAYNLSLEEIIKNIKAANYNYPAGFIKQHKKEFVVRVLGEFKNLKELENLVIAQGQNNEPVYLKNVAKVQDSYKEQTSASHYNGTTSINLLIQKESMKNIVEVCHEVEKAQKHLQKKFKSRLTIATIFRQDKFIKQSNTNLILAAIIGGLIAFFVILLFLQNIKDALSILISIPLSIFIVFIFMFMKKISLNMISMGGLAIGIGMLVDNSIVVLESIHKKKNRSISLKKILEATNEVKSSVIASTLTSVIVFLPIIFVKGIAGSIFGQLAFTIIISLLSSLFISLTLLPLLVYLNWDIPISFSFLSRFGAQFENFQDNYKKFLIKLLPYKRQIILSGPILLILGLILLFFIHKELIPYVDEHKFKIRIEAPEGTPFVQTEKYVKEIEKQLSTYKDKCTVFYSAIGYDNKNIVLNKTEQLKINSAVIYVFLKKNIPTKPFLKKFKIKHPRLKINIMPIEDILPGIIAPSKKKYSILLTGNKLLELRKTAKNLITFLGSKGIDDVENENGEAASEFKLNIDREALSSLGLTIKEVAQTLQAAIKGSQASFFRIGDEEYDIKVRLQKKDRKDTSFLNKIYVKNKKTGVNIPLSAFTVLNQTKGESSIIRKHQERVMGVAFNADLKQKQVEELLKEFKNSIKVPENVNIELQKMDKETRDSLWSLLFAFILAVVLIYMVLASQFENLVHPFIVMFSTPLAITGVALGLILTHKSLNVLSLIGIVMLSGIVVNNAIVLFEYFQILRKKHKKLEESVIEACTIRLRPILMTTLTTILGLLPIAIGLGSGSELQSSMAITVIAGLTFATFLTLIYIPFLYLIIENKQKR